MNTDTQEKRRITSDDLYRFQLVIDPQLSPDGRHVIFIVQRTEKKTEKKYSNLWVVSVDGGEPRQFTYGDQSDRQPRWSPDGTQVAFLSNRKDEKQPQLYILPFHGGEARPLTDLKGNFATFEWSPDGSQLLCQFRKKDQAAIDREEDEQKKKLGVVDRSYTRAIFRLDGVGYLPEEKWHIWTIDTTSGKATQLTEGQYDETEPLWLPDGEQILFTSNRSEDPDFNYEEEDFYLMPVGGGEFQKVETPRGTKIAPSISPDGQWIAYTGSEGRGNWWKNNSLWIVPVDSSAPAHNLTEGHDFHVSNSTLGDVSDRPFTAPVWSPDSQKLYFQVSRHGDTILRSITLEGQIEDVLSRQGVISDFSLDDTRSTLAFMWSNLTDVGQVWVCDLPCEEERQLTHFNQWLDDIDLGQIEEVWFQGPDGNDLQGWILKPPDFEEGRKYPSILEIHGGPWLQYGNLFMYEFYYLAANDYIVYFTNPRGGQGYGETHSKAIHLDWGGPDYADLMTWTDFMEQQPYIDRERMGVTGGSYGGYMSVWIIGHTDRFEAAVAQRVVSNAISFWGSSDLGFMFEDPWADNQPPWENLDAYWNQSPMKYIGNATTPTLIIHSEQDMRCNPEQGTQVYLALKRQGVETQLVLFPEESHGLSRGGRTDRRIVRLNHILGWFDKYLSE